MLKLIVKIAIAVILVALAIMLFVHVLPWVLGVLALAALVKLIHHWLNNRNGLGPIWPWRKDQGGQPTA
jgi:hypothetical protein